MAKVAPLTPNKLEYAEHARVLFAIKPELGTSIEDVIDPKYWVHVAAKMIPRCRIEVLAEDNSYFAELLILATDKKTYAQVAVLRYVNLSGDPKESQVPEATPEPTKEIKVDEFNTADHFVDYVQNNPAKGRVIHRSTKAVVKEGFGSKKEAAAWMREHEAKLAEDKAKATQNLM